MAHDLTGRRFGWLVVKAAAGSKGGRRLWRCACRCGNERDVTSSKLLSGIAVSCGCRVGGVTHGHTRGRSAGMSPTYRSWASMIARCEQPSNPAYKHYKAKGIVVSKAWRRFENFLLDMGERPTLAHTIDRYPDNDGDYVPGNCRWATKRQQANNRRTNRLFVYKGTKVTFAELVRLTGLPRDRLAHRLLRAGWSVEEAITAAPRRGRRTDLE